MNKSSALVVTSISAPNDILSACAHGCAAHDVDFIVIGDVKSPKDFYLENCDFWSIERQRELPFRLAKKLPEQHYARKNIGYLLAMERGAEVVVETDDDNLPLESFWLPRSVMQSAIQPSSPGWINVYRYFSDLNIWPRGFPLECVQQVAEKDLERQQLIHYSPIQQGLADDNPDVDAIYRLILPLPVSFQKNSPVALGKQQWSPFNSQNTTWFKDVFPLMYIPYHCSFRMCDIWRGFVAMRICWENDWNVLFHSATVVQDRNEHDLHRDFQEEIPGYLNNYSICDGLAGLSLKGGVDYLGENLRLCYEYLVRLGHVGKAELPLLEAWLEDTESFI